MTTIEQLKLKHDLKKGLRRSKFSISKSIQMETKLSDRDINRKMKSSVKRNLKKIELIAGMRSQSKPNDWVLGKDGKYVWDESVTAENDSDLNGREYVGNKFSKVKSHFIKNNSWFSRNIGSKRDGLQSFVDSGSYYNAKVPLIIQDVFNRYLWKYNLKSNGNNRLSNVNFDKTNVNDDLEILFTNQNIQVSGALCLNGIENNYNANLNTSAISSKGLSLVDYFDEHPFANSTLVKTFSGEIKGQYFAITNKLVKSRLPVIAVHFDDKVIYKNIKNWYLKHGKNLKNEIEENPWKN
ncbi:hypothetical protein [uncultured Maribacter sp.]|uniref:hypothetical protein n=1 Tax=uncultured Maribacter sp. TaxID=431308 RepID=UPI002616D0E2|nr:hypothetical protein [uncultured Maribacter sp.]